MRAWMRLDTLLKIVCQYLLLGMALLIFVIVCARYVLGFGRVDMQEVPTYLHMIILTLSMGFVFSDDRHVRMDAMYHAMSATVKRRVNLLGNCCFLIPICTVVFVYTLPYVYHSWIIFEGSPDVGGLGGVYILKLMILVMFVLLFFQGMRQVYEGLCEEWPSQSKW